MTKVLTGKAAAVTVVCAGLQFHNNRVFLAVSNEIFVYDTAFNRLNSYRNQYLQRCHEISSDENTLYLTSTDLNSVSRVRPDNECFFLAAIPSAATRR
jgi:hypothetical protein